MASPLPTTVAQQTSSSSSSTANKGDPTKSPPIIVTAPQTPKSTADERPITIPPPTTTSSAAAAGGSVTDKVMSSAANLAQLLPTGTVLAYQALSPSFTNHGTCFPANKWLTAALVTVLSAFCVFFSFTDSVLGPGRKLYYGVATPRAFNVFNFTDEEEKREWGASNVLWDLRLRPLDYVHAFFTAVVFLTVAFGDAGLQRCFFQDASANTNELLKNLPLGMAFLSSFVFMIFPTKRRGIGYSDPTPQRKVS